MSDTVLLAGASGLVGGHLARHLASTERRLLLPLRRTRADLLALPGAEALSWPLPAKLPRIQLALCALGTTLAAAGSAAAFRAVDFDAALALAQAARKAGCQRFGLVSALGADAGSRVLYKRVKGELEQAVEALGFDQLVIVQPSLLLGDRNALAQANRPAEALAQRLAPVYAPLTPSRWRPVPAQLVAKGLLDALATRGAGTQRIGNAELLRA
jgi:uncharacterized protein YbjT (DUF2867 family)